MAAPTATTGSQAAHLPLGVAEDDRLSDGQGVVEVTEGVKLPLFSLHRHKKLLDAFQGQLITGRQRWILLHIMLLSRTQARLWNVVRAHVTPQEPDPLNPALSPLPSCGPAFWIHSGIW